MPAKNELNPIEKVLDSLVIRQLEGHLNGITQTNLINKFRSQSAYGPRFTVHPNAIKKAVGRLAIAGRLSISPAGNDLHVSLVSATESNKEASGA